MGRLSFAILVQCCPQDIEEKRPFPGRTLPFSQFNSQSSGRRTNWCADIFILLLPVRNVDSAQCGKAEIQRIRKATNGSQRQESQSNCPSSYHHNKKPAALQSFRSKMRPKIAKQSPLSHLPAICFRDKGDSNSIQQYSGPNNSQERKSRASCLPRQTPFQDDFEEIPQPPNSKNDRETVNRSTNELNRRREMLLNRIDSTCPRTEGEEPLSMCHHLTSNHMVQMLQQCQACGVLSSGGMD